MIMTTIMTIPTIIRMTTPTPDARMHDALGPAALRRLLLWLSPAYPVGGFAYSHGLEWSIECGDVASRATLTDWVADLLRHGAGRTDTILLARAWRLAGTADLSMLDDLAGLGIALCGSAERRLETLAQGAAFLRATLSAWPHPLLAQIGELQDGEIPYPIAVGAAAALHDVPLTATANAFLAAFAASLVSAGVRLIPIGQTDALRALADLDAEIAALADRARRLTLEDLGGPSFRADIASMRHETQHTRLFRS